MRIAAASKHLPRVVCGLVSIFVSTSTSAQVLFVNASTAGSNNGSNWTDAFNSLQDALAAASARNTDGNPDNDIAEVWVAVGTYMPDGGYTAIGGSPVPGSGDREATFQLLDNVALYGGFAGDEGSLHQRDIVANETILSGDLNSDDARFTCTQHLPDCVALGSLCDDDNTCIIQTNHSENSYHVVTGSDTKATAAIDGFTITAGNANGEGDTFGAGMSIRNGSPTVANCIFRGNSADQGGGGIHNAADSNPTISDCTFTQNTANAGGGFYNSGGPNAESAPRITECTFTKNSAAGGLGYGGGMLNSSQFTSAIVTNCAFYDNSANRGGGMANFFGTNITVTNCAFHGNSAGFGGGGMFNASVGPDLMVTNCTFSGNSTDNLGGGLYIGAGQSTVTNCGFTGNRADLGGGIYNSLTGGSPIVTNCVLWANRDSGGFDSSAQIHTVEGTPVVNYSIVKGGWTGAGGVGVIDADPLFVDRAGPDRILGTMDDDLRLLPGSPAIDAGENISVPMDLADLDGDGNTTEPTPVDLEGHSRILCGVVDMGAFEFGIGDINCDQVKDLSDFADWADCMTGPRTEPNEPACEAFDFNFGGDVDLHDFAGFQRVLGVPRSVR